jgi:hypothetical protein
VTTIRPPPPPDVRVLRCSMCGAREIVPRRLEPYFAEQHSNCWRLRAGAVVYRAGRWVREVRP